MIIRGVMEVIIFNLYLVLNGMLIDGGGRKKERKKFLYKGKEVDLEIMCLILFFFFDIYLILNMF